MMSMVVGGCSTGPTALLEEASSATSQVVCSGVFVSGFAADDIYRLALAPEPGMGLVDWALRYDVDRQRNEVRSQIAGMLESRSVFREGRGCTLMHEASMPEAIQVMPAASMRLPDIAGPHPVVPSSAALRAAIDKAFEEPDGGEARKTAAVVVVHHGRVVGERYASGIGIDTALNGHSLAKSVTNAVIGVLVREKRLDLHDPVAAPEWTAPDPRTRITVDNLLRMDAGFDFDEGQGASTATHIWYMQDDSAHSAAQQPLAAPVGQQWHYNSGGYAILSRMARTRVGGPQQLLDFAHREIFAPLGMNHVTVEFDATGTMMGAHAIYASARDWARFGLLYLNDGIAGDRRILPEGWVRYSTTPTLGGGYGAGFWLNNTNAPVPAWGFPWGLPGAPPDAFMGRGYMGQWLVVVPSEDLVLVRMGFSRGDAGEMTSVARLVEDSIRALNAPQ